MILNIIGAMALLSLLLLKLKCKKLFWLNLTLTFFVFILSSTGLVSYTLLDLLQKEDRLKVNDWGQKNAIVLLCGGSVNWLNQYLILPKVTSYARLHEALRQYLDCRKSKNICKILVTGGNPKDNVSEAMAMKERLIEIGAPPADLLTEDQSRDTEENAKISSSILKSEEFDRIVLVTSGYHLKRATLWFKAHGVTALTAPADHLQATLTMTPKADQLELLDTVLHEIGGLIEYKIKTF